MKAKRDETSTGYRIGAVSKRTGISPDALRIWERRYGAVTPRRSPSGGRLYTSEDITRLTLMKRLVDAGDSIGTVATLSEEELRTRVTESQAVAAAPAPLSRCRLVVVGESLAAKMEAASDVLPAVVLVASFRSPAVLQADAKEIEADILLVEQPTLQVETAHRIIEWMNHIHASRAVIVYRFAAQATLAQLPHSKCSTLRAPIDAQTIQNHCLAIAGRPSAGERPQAADARASKELAPPRRFNDETLARLATLSSAVKCECPHHLAELIASLSAFEEYSTECESRNAQDAALHAYLNATASQARYMIETALSEVLQAENITL